MKYAWIENNRVRDAVSQDPSTLFHPSVAAYYTELVPDHVVNGAQFVEGEWVNPVHPPATEPQPIVPQEVSALAGLAAIDEFGLAEAYTAWASSPERTFLERAFVDKAQSWKRNNQTLIDAVASLGVTGEQLDAMFVRAKELEAVL